MRDQHDSGYDTESYEDIAYVCGQLDGIRVTLETHGSEGAAPLERLLAALREEDGDGDLAASLDALHEALLAVGDAVGVHGRTRSLNPIGVDPAVPDEWVLLCPSGRCSRHAWPNASEPPRCPINSRPLRRERL